MHPLLHTARLLFHGALNDFLRHWQKDRWFEYSFKGKPSVKDVVEAIGVPHVEFGELLLNGASCPSTQALSHGDRVEVFPLQLPQSPAEKPSFVLDVHLGSLARSLRLLGFDTLYEKDYSDHEIASLSALHSRTVLTRDIGLLKHKQVESGYWLRSQHTAEQVEEVMSRFHLFAKAAPFSRCLACNGAIGPVPKEAVYAAVPPKVRDFQQEYFQCSSCHRVYWKGTHYDRMLESIGRMLGRAPKRA